MEGSVLHLVMFLVTLFSVLILSLVINVDGKEDKPHIVPTPIVLWNGKLNSCKSEEILDATRTIRSEESLSSAYIVCLEWTSERLLDITKSVVMGKSKSFSDVLKSVIKNKSKMEIVDMACKMIAEDKKLQRGYHAVGFGDGGLYLRAVAQKCSNPPIFNLITLGTQHQGKFGVAGKDKFLADINNEYINNPNELYRTNLIKLKNLVLLQFEYDEKIDPPQSSFFGFYEKIYDNNNNVISVRVRTMFASKLYVEDRIGLKTLAQSKRLHTIQVINTHLQIDDKWFMKDIVKPYLTENYWVDKIDLE